MENYICVKLDKHLIFNMAKLRFSNHQPETGQYKKKAIDQRLPVCKVCNENGCVEDNFLMTCKAYQTERNEFLKKNKCVYCAFWIIYKPRTVLIPNVYSHDPLLRIDNE